MFFWNLKKRKIRIHELWCSCLCWAMQLAAACWQLWLSQFMLCKLQSAEDKVDESSLLNYWVAKDGSSVESYKTARRQLCTMYNERVVTYWPTIYAALSSQVAHHVQRGMRYKLSQQVSKKLQLHAAIWTTHHCAIWCGRNLQQKPHHTSEFHSLPSDMLHLLSMQMFSKILIMMWSRKRRN